MRIYAKGIAQTFEVYAPERPDATPTIALVDHENVALPGGAPSITIDSVNTTISAPVVAGDRSITVASATGIVPGRDYLLGSTTEEKEFVRVKRIVSTVVHFFSRLKYDHASAAPCVGTRLTAPLSAAALASVTKAGKATVAWKIATVDQVPLVEHFAIVDAPIRSDLTTTHLEAINEQLYRFAGEGIHWQGRIDRARERLYADLARRLDLTLLRGAQDLIREAHAAKTLHMFALVAGPAWESQARMLAAEYESLLRSLEACAIVDMDGDGKANRDAEQRRETRLG